MTLSNEDVRDIVALLDATGFSELNLKTDRYHLVLHRSDRAWVQELTLTTPSNQAVAATPPPPFKAAGEFDIAAPMVGTFYRAPKPGAPAFVDIGSEVEPETVVGLIETMKLMNSVYAGCSGTIREICAQDALFVEPGALLMRVEPHK